MRRWLLLAGLLLAAGCNQTIVESYDAVPGARVDSAYVKRGVNFSRYKRLLPVPLEIYFYEGLGTPAPSDIDRVRQIFRDAFMTKIGDDYEIVNKPGPDVLNVRASLVDLELSEVPDDLPIKGRAASLVAAGQLTFFMELADSQNGEVLARAADREKSPTAITGPATQRDWARTEVAADRWAQLFREFLDANLGR